MQTVQKLNPLDYLRSCTEYELLLFNLSGLRVIELKTQEEPRAKNARGTLSG